MKFYDCATAPSPRRVRIFLAEKEISVPTVQVDLRNGEQFSAEFRAINPACTVPVLELDNGTSENSNRTRSSDLLDSIGIPAGHIRPPALIDPRPLGRNRAAPCML
jgi:hypothetical protein